jgi:hypothetical protein
MKLRAKLIDVADLSSRDRADMLCLMHKHYDHVSPAAFESDLAEKQWVVQVRDGEDRLCGFSTQMVLEVGPIKALFSGDTIVNREHWGDRALTHAVWKLALSLIDKWPDAELYWFLISQGYKTYRFLPLFFREFYPRYNIATPDSVRKVIDALAQQKFGAQYDPIAGIVRSPTYNLRAGIADVTDGRREDPHVRFFVERNRGHVKGDALCCLARLSRENFTDAAHRVLQSK